MSSNLRLLQAIKKLNDKVNNIEINKPLDGRNGIDGYTPIKGVDYRDGIDGKNGKDGIGIKNIKINEYGHLVVYYTNNTKKDLGLVVGKSGPGGRHGTGVKNVEIKDEHLIIYLTDGSEIDAGFVGGGGSGTTNYNDLSNKPKINNIELKDNHTLEELGLDTSDKYDKTGGEITGNVKIDGNLTLDIEDEDYDAGIKLVQKLDNNLGTTLTFNGYANGEEPTNYKTVLRNIANPNSDYDAANKRYVDGLVSTVWLTGFDNEDGTILVSSTAYNSCYEAITTNKQCFLKITGIDKINIYKLKRWENYNEHKQGNDAFMFIDAENNDTNARITITKTSAIIESKQLEHIENKVSNWSETVNDINYPTEKLVKDTIDALKEYVDDEYGPHVLYETDGTTGLLGLNNTSAGNWQLEDLDMTPYKRIKVYVKMGSDKTTGYMDRLTPPITVELMLDEKNTDSRYGNGAFAGTGCGINPQNRNMWFIVMCVIDNTKTKFKCTEQISLYGTAVTARNDNGRFIYKIEGYKH